MRMRKGKTALEIWNCRYLGPRDLTMESRRVDQLTVCFATSWRPDMKPVGSRGFEGGWIEELWVLRTIPYGRTSKN